MISFSSDEKDLFYDVRNQLHDDLRRREEAAQERRRALRRSIARVEDLSVYRKNWQDNLLHAIGGLPEERCPLNARLTGVATTDEFRVEKVVFESLPNFFVTGCCYVPHGLTGRAPAVLLLQGHVNKPWPAYQQLCCDLARAGFVTLMIDPIGQAERSQYFSNGRYNLMSINTEHNQAGCALFLHGQSLARYWAWDSIRAVDYLCSRDDVDGGRIGATGHSGGGWQTFLLMALDDRLAAAAPCAITTTLHWIMKSAEPVDAEHILHNAMELGPDYLDFLTAMAPRPVLGLATSYDRYFPIEGTLEAADWARHVYELHDAPEAFEMVVDDDVHEYTQPLREACVRFFRKHLCGEDAPFSEENPLILPSSDLQVTRGGQICVDEPACVSIADLCARASYPIHKPASPEALREKLDEMLGVSQAGDRQAPIRPRRDTCNELNGYPLEKLLFFSADDVMVAGVVCHPRDASSDKPLPTVLFLNDGGTSVAKEMLPRIEGLLDSGKRVVVYDARGVGAVANRKRVPAFYENSTWTFHGDAYNNACDAIQLGVSLMGLRLFDILRCVDYLRSRGDVSVLEMYGIGQAALMAYLTGALDERIKSVTCEDMLCSYRAITEEPYYNSNLFPLEVLPWGILRFFDLPDLLPCYADREFHLLNPVDAKGHPANARQKEQWTV